MAEKMNKLQIRAEVFSAMNSVFLQQDNTENAVDLAIKRLQEIEDKDFLAKLLIKEFIASDESDRSALISLMLLNCVPVEELEANLWSNLALKTVSDNKKYQLIDILKSMGKFVEYDKYLDYFEEPQNVIDMDTHKLLNSAMLNPEAQIDFLDFLSTLSLSDKKLLVESIGEDYPPDDLANILSPIILSESDVDLIEQILSLLVKSKSPLVYYPIINLSELTKNEYLKKLAQKSLKEIKFAGVSSEKADEYYKNKFSNSILYNCYTSLVDGKGNQGLLFSRIRSDNSIQMFCVVINDSFGILDCFGFNTISQTEFTLMLDKFFAKNVRIAMTFETALSWLKDAEKLTFEKSNTLPYEYTCWKEILFDVKQYEEIDKDTISSALAMLPQVDFEFDDLFENNYLDKLYFSKEDNPVFLEFLKEIDLILSNEETINLGNIENCINSKLDSIFDETTVDILKKRILKIAFCLMTNSKLKDASMLYSLTKNDLLMKKFFVEIMKKSLFEFYKEEYIEKMNKNSDNIFIKHSQQLKTKLDVVKLSDLLKNILEEWGRDE